MSTDNRTELNDCDTATGWTGDGPTPSTNTTIGQYYQGTGSLETQHTNTDEHAWTTEDTLNGGTFSLDLSDTTMYMQIKDNLIDTAANGGMQYVISDTTNRIGYDVGGNDAVGLSLPTFFNSYKLDVSNLPASFTTFAGTEANLTTTTITEVGVGTLHLAKAVGNVANIFIDYFAYIANGSYALTINGGTVGTPETMVDVQGDDVTNGWGLVSNPLGDQYSFFAPTEWGNAAATADVYFTATDEQWFWIGDNGGGHAVGATHFPFRIVGNATDTIDIKWTNLVIVNTGTPAEFIAGDINVDVMEFTNVSFTGLGTITFPANDVNKFADNCTFNNCGQVDPAGTNMDSPSFNGTTDANGALLIDESVDNVDNAVFLSDGTGHAIYITATGTYNFDNWTFSGFGADGTTDAVVYNNSGGAVTINILNGGDTPSVRNGTGASTTINNSVTLLVQGVTEGAAVKIVADETVGTITIGDVLLEALADVNGEASTTLNYEGAFAGSPAVDGLEVITRVRSSGLPTAAIQDDNGVFTDETTAANSAVAADMNLLPATPVVNQDRYLFGHAEMFNKMKIAINTAGTGGFTITWQYWNGAWTNLTGVVDDTSSFSVLGTNYISFTMPGDWTKTTINGQGPYYYIRAAYTAGTVTVTPTGTRCSLDVNKYLPFVQNGTVTANGLTVTASWVKDTIATF
jgi:hypothetical protein